MKLKAPLKENIRNTMRGCGYYLEKQDARTGEMAFSRPAGGASASGYPRFHIYARTDEISRETIFNLHLDQKKPSYSGSAAHGGEYEGATVEREAERIKNILGL